MSSLSGDSGDSGDSGESGDSGDSGDARVGKPNLNPRLYNHPGRGHRSLEAPGSGASALHG